MGALIETLKTHFPPYDSLRYYHGLFRGDFSREDTMRAHSQDLARSVGCLGLREIQIAKLGAFCTCRGVEPKDQLDLRSAIEDELPAAGRPSHLDVRLQMFDNLGLTVDNLMSVLPLPQAVEGTRLFRSIFTDRDLLEITAAVGTIDLWYVPLARLLFESYLSLGYSAHQLATYSLHMDADTHHSSAALSFVEKYVALSEHAQVISSIHTGFQSVVLYDEARYAAATDRERHFNSFFCKDR